MKTASNSMLILTPRPEFQMPAFTQKNPPSAEFHKKKSDKKNDATE